MTLGIGQSYQDDQTSCRKRQVTLGIGQSYQDDQTSCRKRQKRNPAKMSCDGAQQSGKGECADACRAAAGAHTL